MTLAKLRKLMNKATPLPWNEDDGNIFSKPLSDARSAAIVAMREARRAGLPEPPHPDEDSLEPMGWVASTGQLQPNFVNDAAFIPAAVNALPALLDIAEAAQKHLDANIFDDDEGIDTRRALRAALAKLSK